MHRNIVLGQVFSFTCRAMSFCHFPCQWRWLLDVLSQWVTVNKTNWIGYLSSSDPNIAINVVLLWFASMPYSWQYSSSFYTFSVGLTLAVVITVKEAIPQCCFIFLMSMLTNITNSKQGVTVWGTLPHSTPLDSFVWWDWNQGRDHTNATTQALYFYLHFVSWEPVIGIGKLYFKVTSSCFILTQCQMVSLIATMC